MSFLKGLFHHEANGKSVVLIDIAADSVGGGYARFEAGKQPVLLYVRRIPIETRSGENPAEAMLRALRALGDALVREGAPELRRAAGSGSADSVFISLDTPWQETSVRTERIEREKPFTFTPSIAAAALERARAVPPGKRLMDESLIGISLNGYETRRPYGKTARRASVVALSSSMDETAAENVASLVRDLFHTKAIRFVAGSSLRYQAVRTLFEHERDALIFDAAGPLVSIALVRGGLLVALSEIAVAGSWEKTVMDEFAVLAKRYPLPRTIFLLARENEADVLRKRLAATNVNGLWLAERPPRIVPILASHLVGAAGQVRSVAADLELIFMTTLYQQRLGGGDS